MRLIERTNEPIESITKFYESQGYGGGAHESDSIFLGYIEDKLICVVRIASENEIPVLRGMYVRKDKRGEGFGKIVLKLLEPHLRNLNSPCFCIPKSNLEKFYERAAFKKIDESEAPVFLRERMQAYLKNGHDVILMKRKS